MSLHPHSLAAGMADLKVSLALEVVPTEHEAYELRNHRSFSFQPRAMACWRAPYGPRFATLGDQGAGVGAGGLNSSANEPYRRAFLSSPAPCWTGGAVNPHNLYLAGP